MRKKEKKALLLVAMSIVALFGMGWLVHRTQQRGDEQQREIVRLFSRIQEEKGDKREELVQHLSFLLDKEPDLQPLYLPYLTQHAIIHRKVEEKESLILEWLNRMDLLFPSLYNDYAKTTLLIERGEYEQALKETLQFKEEVSGQKESRFLLLMVLTRIYILQRVLEHSDLATLKERFLDQIKQHQLNKAQSDEFASPYEQLSKHYVSGNYTFSHFLDGK